MWQMNSTDPISSIEFPVWKVCIARRVSPARNFDAFYIFTIKFFRNLRRAISKLSSQVEFNPSQIAFGCYPAGEMCSEMPLEKHGIFGRYFQVKTWILTLMVIHVFLSTVSIFFWCVQHFLQKVDK
jgi:hypothetical protein